MMVGRGFIGVGFCGTGMLGVTDDAPIPPAPVEWTTKYQRMRETANSLLAKIGPGSFDGIRQRADDLLKRS